MTVSRWHELANGRTWGTSIQYEPSVVIPVSQVKDMTAEEIGAAVISLAHEATVTYLLDWLDTWEANARWRQERFPKRRHVELCMSLGGRDECSRTFVSDLSDAMQEMEKFMDRNEELRAGYLSICDDLDATYNYIVSKKSPITPLQDAARRIILELRHGCALCGMLGGNHTPQCRGVEAIDPS
jgi:hypothetical protein